MTAHLTPAQVHDIEDCWPVERENHSLTCWAMHPRCAIARLIASHRALEQDGKENVEIVEWYGTLVKRAQIGTKETPSLKAYIEQLEAEATRLLEENAALVKAAQDELAKSIVDTILRERGNKQALTGQEATNEG